MRNPEWPGTHLSIRSDTWDVPHRRGGVQTAKTPSWILMAYWVLKHVFSLVDEVRHVQRSKLPVVEDSGWEVEERYTMDF